MTDIRLLELTNADLPVLSQLAVRAPDVYGNFIALAPQREPTLGTRQETVKAAFGGV